jgi:acyl-coenzyme A thioesterase PaaI-like protein
MATAERAPPAFFTRYGLSRTGDPDAPLLLEPYPEICHRGVVRTAVIASAVDIAGSLFAREIAGGDATFTSDLSVRAPARFVPERVVARASLLRAGRNLITTAVVLEAGGAPWAYGQTSFTRVARRGGASDAPPSYAMPRVIERVPLERPLVEEVGIEVVDAARGHLEVELRDALRNPEGVMQGALVALLTEVAAETLADYCLGSPQVVSELDVRYLAMGRVGPIVSEAQWIGEPADGMLRVELRDRGHGDRITTAALLRVHASPHGIATRPKPLG